MISPSTALSNGTKTFFLIYRFFLLPIWYNFSFHTVVGFLPVGLDSSEIQGLNSDDKSQYVHMTHELLNRIETEELNSASDQLHEDMVTDIVDLSHSLHPTTQTTGRHIKQELLFRIPFYAGHFRTSLTSCDKRFQF